MILHTKDHYFINYLLAVWDNRSSVCYHAKTLHDNFGFEIPFEFRINYEQIVQWKDPVYSIELNTKSLSEKEAKGAFLSKRFENCAITDEAVNVNCFINGERERTGLRKYETDVINKFVEVRLKSVENSAYKKAEEDNRKLKDILDGNRADIRDLDHTDPARFSNIDLMRIAQIESVIWLSEDPTSTMMGLFKGGVDLKNIVLVYNLIKSFNDSLAASFSLDLLRKQHMSRIEFSFRQLTLYIFTEIATNKLTPEDFFRGPCKPFEEDSMLVIKSAYNTHSMSAQMNESESLKIKRRQHL